MVNKLISFNWSSLDQNKIVNHIKKIKPKICQLLTIEEFHKVVVNHLKKLAPLRFKKRYNDRVEPNLVYVGGCYWSFDDQEGLKPIEVIFEYQSYDTYIKLTPKKFIDLCYLISDVLLHEIIHMRQYRRRNFQCSSFYESNVSKSELRREQNYLGDNGELDAYGFNIASELLRRFNGNKKEVIEYLTKDLRKEKGRSNSWKMYMKTFEFNHNHTIIKRLKRRVIRYLPHAEIGKPYQNNHWLWY